MWGTSHSTSPKRVGTCQSVSPCTVTCAVMGKEVIGFNHNAETVHVGPIMVAQVVRESRMHGARKTLWKVVLEQVFRESSSEARCAPTFVTPSKHSLFVPHWYSWSLHLEGGKVCVFICHVLKLYTRRQCSDVLKNRGSGITLSAFDSWFHHLLTTCPSADCIIFMYFTFPSGKCG